MTCTDVKKDCAVKYTLGSADDDVIAKIMKSFVTLDDLTLSIAPIETS